MAALRVTTDTLVTSVSTTSEEPLSVSGAPRTSCWLASSDEVSRTRSLATRPHIETVHTAVVSGQLQGASLHALEGSD